MNYLNINPEDIVNGPGIRVSLFVSGCSNKCKGCFNKSSWNFESGVPFSDDILEDLISKCDKDTISGLSLLGGDPMHPRNQEDISRLVKRFKEVHKGKDIWMWSGYTWEDMQPGGSANTEYTRDILSNVDVLVDGPFIEELKSLRLKYKGSKNQRLLDLKATTEKGKPVLYKLPRKM